MGVKETMQRCLLALNWKNRDLRSLRMNTNCQSGMLFGKRFLIIENCVLAIEPSGGRTDNGGAPAPPMGQQACDSKRRGGICADIPRNVGGMGAT